jgi:hypothetical protein
MVIASKKVAKRKTSPTRRARGGLTLRARDKRFGSLKKGVAASALAFAIAWGSAGCRHLSYSELRDYADQKATKQAARAVDVVPGADKVAREVADKTLEVILGPNPAKVLREIEADSRWGGKTPVSTKFWFMGLGLNPREQADRHHIDLVERIARKSKIPPAEAMLIIGAYSNLKVQGLGRKITDLKSFIKKNNAQIALLRADAKSFQTKHGRRKDILTLIRDKVSANNNLLPKLLVLEKLLEIREIDSNSFEELMGIAKAQLSPVQCLEFLNRISINKDLSLN